MAQLDACPTGDEEAAGLTPAGSTTFFLPASVALLGGLSDWRPGGGGFNTRRGRQHSFLEIDHEIFSTVILSC